MRRYFGISQHWITPILVKLPLLHNLFVRFLIYVVYVV